MGKSKFQISRSLDEKIRRIISGSGLAFFRKSPTDEEIKTNLKAIRHYSSSPNGLGSFKSDKNEHLFLIYGVDENTKQVDKRIFNFSKGTFVRRKSHRLEILNDPFCPRNVYDGSEDAFTLGDDDSMSSSDDDQIDHLIFFIHGVGGVCDVRFRSCVEVVSDFKKMANTLLALHSNPSSGASTPTNRHLARSLKKGFFRKQSTDSTTSRGSDISDSMPPPRPRVRKVECLPISWHSLTRRQTAFSEQLSQISLSSVPKLRHFLNKVVMDAMLYSTGPVYTQTILNNVGNEINRLYTLFMERHPNFTGSVSLAGHSLGSVIVFDLLAHQIPSQGQQDAMASTAVNKPATSTSQDTENSRSHINNNNNNINNNNGPHLATSINTRRHCLNVAHHHRCVTADDKRYCSDYTNLEELLKDMDLTSYAELFQKEHIDLNSLLLLTDLDMKELQLPLGARRKLGTYMNFKKASRVPVAQEEPEGSPSNDPTQTRLSASEKLCNPFGNMNTGQSLVEYPQLKFKPRCFFSFGSPTTMFLNVRGIQELSADYKLPTCDRMLNIFHPYDPLAYRFEPLIDARFKDVDPVLIPHHRGGKRMHVQLREGFAKVGHDIKHRLFGSLKSTWTSFTRMGTTEVSPEPSLCASLPAEFPPGEEMNVKRQKLSSAGNPSSGERDSFETCSSNLSCGPNGMNAAAANEQTRNPLRRQNDLCRSQAEVATSLGAAPSSLSSIIESSMNDSSGMEDESNSDASVLRRLKTFKLDGKQAGEGETKTSTSKAKESSSSTDHCDLGSEKQLPFDRHKAATSKELSVDETRVGRLNNGRRIDFVLQEKPIELFNEYIFAFTSHANYWANEDSALIILKEIYQVDGVHLVEQADS